MGVKLTSPEGEVYCYSNSTLATKLSTRHSFLGCKKHKDIASSNLSCKELLNLSVNKLVEGERYGAKAWFHDMCKHQNFVNNMKR